MNNFNNASPPDGDDETACTNYGKDEGASDMCAETSGSRKHVTRKKKMHMNEAECFSYIKSEEGASALSEPKDLTKSTTRDPNYRLMPVDRSRKRKRKNSYNKADIPDETDNAKTHSCMPDILGSQGFRSASDMYNIAKKTGSIQQAQPSTFTYKGGSGVKPKLNKNSLLANQTSIMSFMKAGPSKEGAEGSQKSVASSHKKMDSKETESKPKRTVMYSPIKKIDGPVYISDSPSSSPLSSSQGSSMSSQSVDLRDNAVVKQLFDAQKHLDSLPKNKKPSQLNLATKSKYLDRKHSLSKCESVASVSDFENDSFDMNLAFGSDMDDTLVNAGQKKKDVKGDKYGLLGSGAYPSEPDKTGVNYFELLPPEVLENIFCQLPMLDLCLNSNRVCLAWNDIIASEKVS